MKQPTSRLTNLMTSVMVCWLVSLLLVVPALAQGGIRPGAPKVESKFAEYIRYSLPVQSDEDIKAATLFASYRTGERSSSTTTRSNAVFGSGRNVTAVFTRTLERGALVPGTDIEYYWEIENASGQKLKTATFKYTYLDDRFDFKAVSKPVGSGKVTLYWYGADEAYGQQRLNVSVAAIEKLQKQIGVELQEEAKVFIYRTRNDMLAALASKGTTADTQLTVLGQLAGPTTVLLLGSDNGIDNTTYHELSHLVVHLATYNALIGGVNIPAWLDEGLSMFNQLTVEGGYLSSLDRATRANALISVRSLSSVPGPPDQVILFYGQSYSLVKYLVEQHGKEKMVQLLGVFKRGSSPEDALKQVYGFGVDELDRRWRESLGAAPREAPNTQPTTAPGAVTPPTAVPAGAPAAPAAPFACACLSGFIFLGLWWAIKRT